MLTSGEDADGSGLQTAVSVRVPLEHDLDPDKVYPLLQVGVHVAPSARVEVHPEPGAPFVMAPDASHEDGTLVAIPHFSTRPAVTVSRSASVSSESKISTSPTYCVL